MTTTANHQQILPIHCHRAPLIGLVILPGQVRRNGHAPLLRKSIPAQMAAAAQRQSA